MDLNDKNLIPKRLFTEGSTIDKRKPYHLNRAFFLDNTYKNRKGIII